MFTFQLKVSVWTLNVNKSLLRTWFEVLEVEVFLHSSHLIFEPIDLLGLFLYGFCVSLSQTIEFSDDISKRGYLS